MTAKIRRRLTFSNVVAVIAVFIALGGSAYAAHKISGKAIKKNSEPGSRLKNNSVSGDKLQNNTISGAKINLGSLGAVPSATTARNVFGVSVDSAGNAKTATLSGTTAKLLSTTGDYSVTFPRSLQGCVAAASSQTFGEVGANQGAFGASTVEVFTNNSAGTPTNQAFNLVVVC